MALAQCETLLLVRLLLCASSFERFSVSALSFAHFFLGTTCEHVFLVFDAVKPSIWVKSKITHAPITLIRSVFDKMKDFAHFRIPEEVFVFGTLIK
jgi:hypothetical protein